MISRYFSINFFNTKGFQQTFIFFLSSFHLVNISVAMIKYWNLIEERDRPIWLLFIVNEKRNRYFHIEHGEKSSNSFRIYDEEKPRFLFRVVFAMKYLVSRKKNLLDRAMKSNRLWSITYHIQSDIVRKFSRTKTVWFSFRLKSESFFVALQYFLSRNNGSLKFTSKSSFFFRFC